MIRWFVAVGWFVTGGLVGALLLSVLVLWGGFEVDRRMPIVDLAQLTATIFLALYIPFAVERYRDRTRSVRALLIDDVKAFMTVVEAINAVLTACTNADATTPQDVMRIRTGFLAANVRIGRLEKRLLDTFPNHRCRLHFDPFKGAYLRYWQAVTGGALYGGAPIDWDLWRKQEFAFASLEHAGAELVRYLSTS